MRLESMSCVSAEMGEPACSFVNIMKSILKFIFVPSLFALLLVTSASAGV